MSNGLPLDERGQLEKVFNDVYFGNGKPGLVTRMQTAENRIDTGERAIAIVTKQFWAIIILLIAILAGVVVDYAKEPSKIQATHTQSDVY